MRSRRHAKQRGGNIRGITSACAEQTCVMVLDRLSTRDHLRVCGADVMAAAVVVAMPGSPPRVRSRLAGGVFLDVECGITSACAEQTTHSKHSHHHRTDHLRVCGADTDLQTETVHGLGSPPRVRSRLPSRASSATHGRITSACAEQTRLMMRYRIDAGDHLRVCGADNTEQGRANRDAGSPPRVRSRHRGDESERILLGITSACAEQTRHYTCVKNNVRDHLRVCGADHHRQGTGITCAGSPPRVRSRLLT